jgi:uncharacterized protein
MNAECLSPRQQAAHDHLVELLTALERVVVAFSGGIDSTVLLRVAVAALGGRAVGLTAVSESFAPWELEDARTLAAQMGARLIEVRTRELDRPGYRANAGDRCYHCKTELFEIAAAYAAHEDLGALVYGAIPEDLGDHRPGMRAASEHGVRAPLIQAGLSKADVRAIARAYGLPTAEKPASACLSSRFPDGTPVTASGLERVSRCEGGLRSLGLVRVRARYHDDVVRLEFGPDELARLFCEPGLRAAVIDVGRTAGFRFVAVDLEGYRTGSANTLLQVTERRRD